MTHVSLRDGPIMASVFNRLSQYANSEGKRAYCYTELAISSLAVTETITITHCTYPPWDGQVD